MFIKNVNRKLRNNLIQGVPYHFRSFLALNQGDALYIVNKS